MQKLLVAISLLLTAVLATDAQKFSNETLHYKVEYKWGIISKTAGNVSLSLRNTPDSYVCNLYGKSASWADRYFKVRDTLRCEIMKNGFRPVFYEKMAHEGKDHKHDYVSYRYEGGKVFGDCLRKKVVDGKVVTDKEHQLEATGTTVDMLTAFYYMRALPYNEWTKGQVQTINIFSGKQKELLTIKYLGDENVTYDKKTYECYHITFKFTSDGKKKSSDDMDAWISKNGNHIPVKLEGSLPIGKIRCFYTD